MFRVTLPSPTNRTTTRLFGRLVAPVAILGVTAPLLAAEPSWRGGERDDRNDRWRDWSRGRDDDRGHDRDRRNRDRDDHGSKVDVRVVIGGGGIRIGAPVCRPVVVRPAAAPVCREVMPCDLKLSAYQSGNTVIVIASGSNHTGGFRTTLTATDVHDGTPELVLCNLAPSGCATQCITTFESRASFETCHRLRCVKVRVAGQCLDVPVAQVKPAC